MEMIAKNRELKLAIIGLGYVGLPLAVEFGTKQRLIGFDLKKSRVEELRNGFDRTQEISAEQLMAAKHLRFTDDNNIIAGLMAKGKAKKDYSGFVLD